MVQKTTLLFIRHGQTAMNKRKRYCGHLDAVLNKTGRRQAGDLFKRLRAETIHKVYASDRKRAIETARIALAGFPIEKDPGLKEINFGLFEGLSHGGILKRYPVVYRRWLKDPFKTKIPEGESVRYFTRRITQSIKRIVAVNRGMTIAVVTHGGVISMYLNSLSKTHKFWETIPKSASISIVEYEKQSARVRVFNDTAHLDGKNG